MRAGLGSPAVTSTVTGTDAVSPMLLVTRSSAVCVPVMASELPSVSAILTRPERSPSMLSCAVTQLDRTRLPPVRQTSGCVSEKRGLV